MEFGRDPPRLFDRRCNSCNLFDEHCGNLSNSSATFPYERDASRCTTVKLQSFSKVVVSVLNHYDCSTFLALEGIPCVPRSWKLSVKGSCIQVEVLQTRHVPKPAGCNWVVKGIVGKIKFLKVCKVEARERLVCAG